MNKFDLLKSLAPGFLPLIIFILADAVWGTRIGLIVAVAVGIVEFAVSYIREKVVDKFLLLDIGLIVVLGAVSVALDNDIFFKLKPAVIELIFCVLLGISAFTPMNIMLMMSKRYMKNIDLNDAAVTQLTRTLKVMFFLFLAHTVMIVYSAFFMSKEAWAFVSGGLFYIIFVVYFVYELAKNKIKRKRWLEQFKDDEWFDIVDEEGRVTGRAPRALCHSGPGMMHPVVHLHVVDSKDRVYLQKRPISKQIQPGKWDTAVGGHVMSGEKVEEALLREAEEELGLKDFKYQLIGRYKWETDVETELVFMFVTLYDRAITFNRDEIEDGRFWKIKKIRDALDKEMFTPNFIFEFDILLKALGKSSKKNMPVP
jgi:isopentenyldiphosphate isomerase/intracellular septation protein A